jgi:chromate transporter
MSAEPQVSLHELTAQSFKVGVLGFGGPAGQIALMHRIFVDEKKWLDEERYLHALNYCMLLPGPEAQQLAVYAGWILNGVRGGLIAGTLFVLPGAIIVFALSWLYAAHADIPSVAAIFYGVKIAVVAIVAEAVARIGQRALKGRGALFIAIAAFVALFFFGAPFPLVIVAAAAVGAFRAARDTDRSRAGENPAQSGSPPPRGRSDRARSTPQILWTALAWGFLWLMPLIASLLLLGGDHLLTRVGFLFSELAVVTFGGAYAVLAYLQQQAVDVEGWLTAGQMIDGLGLAETTPGPLILVNQFVGFLAGWNAGGFGLAAAAAAMASWQTFAPSFVWIFAGAPFAERLRENRYAQGALAAITAAVLGVISNLALWFALHVVFTQTNTLETPWGNTLPAPALASFDWIAASLAVAAGVALIRFKTNMLVVIAACAAAGLARLAIT